MSVTLNHHPPAAVADSELSKWRRGVSHHISLGSPIGSFLTRPSFWR